MRRETPIMQWLCVCCVVVFWTALPGCAGPKPIFYPNAKIQQVGEDGADKDIDACREVAENAGADEGPNQAGRAAGSTAMGAGAGAASGAIGGAISGGDAGIGALIGLASGAVWGLFSWLFGWMFSSSQPSQAYVNMVNRCLAEKGYEVSGWQ